MPLLCNVLTGDGLSDDDENGLLTNDGVCNGGKAKNSSDINPSGLWKARLDKLDMLEIPESESESLHTPLNWGRDGRIDSDVCMSGLIERCGYKCPKEFGVCSV